MPNMPITRVVLYKHGVGYFEREGRVADDATVELAFKSGEVSDVLKSLTVLDLDGGHVSSISYDATTPPWKLLEEIAIDPPEGTGLLGLLPQLQGAEVEVALGSDRVRGHVLGVDRVERRANDEVVMSHRLSLLTADGDALQIDLDDARAVRILDEKLRRDLDFFLRTRLASKKKDARVFTFFAQGTGERRLRISYTLATPVWKATYRILLPEADSVDEPLIQGWAVVDNTHDEDWDEVELALVAGLPISFVHDLYSPRYLSRPIVEVREQGSIAPPVVEDALYQASRDEYPSAEAGFATGPLPPMPAAAAPQMARAMKAQRPVSSVEVQTRERQVGDLFQYSITRPVTIKRNQSALVPIVLEPFRGRGVLLYNAETRDRNPLSAVELENTTGLTLEGGPVTVIEGDTYSGEAMVETIKPEETRLVPYSVELGVVVDSSSQVKAEHVHRARISRGVLHAYSYEQRCVLYAARNKSGRARTLYVEHRREHGWGLVEPENAHETTPGFYRFKVDLAERGTTELKVSERHEIESRYALVNATSETILDYRASRYIDDRVLEALKHVVELKERAARLDAQTAEANAQIATIGNDQHRIRENLKSIGEAHDERRLRTTLVEKLLGQEQQLDALGARARELAAERQRLQQEIDAAIHAIEFETVVE